MWKQTPYHWTLPVLLLLAVRASWAQGPPPLYLREVGPEDRVLLGRPTGVPPPPAPPPGAAGPAAAPWPPAPVGPPPVGLVPVGPVSATAPLPPIQLLPESLLWEPPLASPHEPRMAIRFSTAHNPQFYDGAIDGVIGGQFGLFRVPFAGCPDQGFQLDAFGVVFSRLSMDLDLAATDYRFGIPLTWAYDSWQIKVAYEHTSVHAGDKFLIQTGLPRRPYVRDEVVLGVAYRFLDQLRVYGQFGYAIKTDESLNHSRTRYDWGVEWSLQGPTGWAGQPFLAFDMDLRAEQDFQPGVTFQAGWQWRSLPDGRSFRIGLELYDGRSIYGQFQADKENWVGLVLLYDW